MEILVDTGKPPYRLPTMADLAAEPNGYRLVSTFSGCGGSCLGFRAEGFETVYASEFVDVAAETYEANFPGVPVDRRDVREIDPEEILAAIGGPPDVAEGSPPCAAFSTSGMRASTAGAVRSYSGKRQRVDDLFDEYVRLVRGLRPRVFVAENVAGLATTTRGKAYLRHIGEKMREAGYRVQAKILDASWLGVPQTRRRLIFLGIRDDLDVGHRWPEPLPYRYTLRAALDAAESTPEEREEASIARYAIGRAWEEIRPGEWHPKYRNLGRPLLDLPCPTVTQTGSSLGAASVCHPHEKRKLTIPELRAVSGFPVDFVLPDDYDAAYERIGRAVPPPMMRAVARCVREILDETREPAEAAGSRDRRVR